jgi:hypothetical protein
LKTKPQGKLEVIAVKWFKKLIKKYILMLANHILDEDAKNIDRAPQRRALITINGLIMEFGVYKGESINFIADLLPNRQIYGFDSFEGLPETWRYNFYKGTFKLNNLPEVRKNVVLVKGLFEDTLPKFKEAL